MLKHVLLAGGMLIATPALAQVADTGAQTQAGRTPMAPTPATPQTSTQATPQATTAPQTATQPAPAAPAGATTAQTAPAPAQPATQTAQQPASGASQVATIVDQEFATYDKDGDGKLNEAEFTAWMVALKTKSDPTTNAESPETKKWMTAAFAQADTDKNAGLTKAELTGFLSQGQG